MIGPHAAQPRCPDGPRSRALGRLLRRALRLTERLHDDDHLFILGDDAGSVLALSAGEPPPTLPRTNHFGFQLAGGDEVRAAREHFQAAGVEEAEWHDDGRFVRVQVADPDGYRVDLYAF